MKKYIEVNNIKRKNKWAILIPILIVIGFIWSNSMDSSSASYEKSNFFLKHASEILSDILSPDNKFLIFFKGHVRKIAHFLEYALLGNVISISMFAVNKKKARHFYYAFSFAVITAVIDEYIQIYTLRGSSVRDIVIDFSGFTVGFILITIIYFLYVSLKKFFIKEK